MDETELKIGLTKYVAHLQQVARVFNSVAATEGLPVAMHPESAIEAVRDKNVGLARISSFWQRLDDTGIVHDAQLETAVRCVFKLWNEDTRCGHVVGAMQSGKTTTSLALQWAGPILYQLTGQRAYPFYIIGNQRNHQDQTMIELDRFLTYYGNIEIRTTNGSSKANDAMFVRSPSLVTYREHVLRDAKKYLVVPHLEDNVHRRVGGEQSLGKIVQLCSEAKSQGLRPLMLIDEPQFGASDRLIKDEDGETRRPCMLAQIFRSIEKALESSPDDHWFVGLSATPFEMNDVEAFWEVRQSLTEAYSGFNFFNGEPIAPGVAITPPTTFSLTAYASSLNVPFLASVSLAAYDKPKTFATHADRIGFGGDHAAYQNEVAQALRETIYAAIETYRDDSDWPVGLCIRAFNDNKKTQALVERLNLDPARIEILPYFGTDTSGVSVKRAVAARNRPDLPYLILVTNRARMADAFPGQVRFFMDLAQKASDLNALLQGLLGRACGYGKRSSVILSDANAGIVDAYVATNGGYVHKTSRHTVTVGGYRRGAPTAMLRVRDDMTDDVVKKYFERVNTELVSKIPAGPKMQVERMKGNEPRRSAILQIAQELSLFDHIEQPAVRAELYPNLPSGFQVLRPGEVRRERGEELGYSLDTAGNCRFTYRHVSRLSAAKGGGAGRAKGKKDKESHLEPTIYVEKMGDDGLAIPASDKTKPGSWRAFMVTFPLKNSVRELRQATVALPVAHSPYDHYMNDGERAQRDGDAAHSDA